MSEQENQGKKERQSLLWRLRHFVGAAIVVLISIPLLQGLDRANKEINSGFEVNTESLTRFRIAVSAKGQDADSVVKDLGLIHDHPFASGRELVEATKQAILAKEAWVRSALVAEQTQLVRKYEQDSLATSQRAIPQHLPKQSEI